MFAWAIYGHLLVNICTIPGFFSLCRHVGINYNLSYGRFQHSQTKLKNTKIYKTYHSRDFFDRETQPCQ